MKTIKLLILLTVTLIDIQSWTDWNCVNQCTDSGSTYAYCVKLCGY